MGENDVDALHSVKQLRALDEPLDTGPSVNDESA